MVEAAKITLSDKELELVCNTDWIFTKHTVIQKMLRLFGNLVPVLENELEQAKERLPKEIFINRAKISKGDNYQLLPYVMLDYPRCFEKYDTLAIRTFFWWGNFFSCTLHLSGAYKTMFEHSILKNLATLHNTELFICVNEEEWEHHFETKNYIAVDKLTTAEITAIANRQHFIKMAAKFSLHQWSVMEELLEKSFSDALHLLKY